MTNEQWVSSQLSSYHNLVANLEVPIVVEDQQAERDKLAQKLLEIAQDAYLACRAMEVAIAVITGMPCNLGCVAP